MKNNIILIAVSFLFVACSATKPELEFNKPEVQVPKELPQAKKKIKALYILCKEHLYLQIKKDLQVGDIIQIVINEGFNFKTNNKKRIIK